MRYICQNQLDKACFPHDLFSSSKTATHKLLHDKAFNIAKSPKTVGYKRRLASMIYIFLIKNNSDVTVKNEIMSNKELAAELHKPIIKKIQKGKGRSRILAFVMFIDIGSKYSKVMPLKGRKVLQLLILFKKYHWD